MKGEIGTPGIRFQFAENGTMISTNSIQFLPELCTGGPITDDWFRNISDSKPQWQFTKQDLHTKVSTDHSGGLPPKGSLQLAPLPRLQQVGVGVLGEEMIPIGEGDERHEEKDEG